MDLDQTQTIIGRHYAKYFNLTVALHFLLVFLAFGFLYYETIDYLLKNWLQIKSGEYAHGFVVIAVAGFMVWGKREGLGQTIIQPEIIAFIPLVFFSLTWMVGILAGIRLIENLSLFMLIVSTIYTLAGKRFTLQLWFPLAFLLIAFPVWEPALPLLQSIAALLSHTLLQLTGMPVIRQGAYIAIPEGKFLIAEGCSGLRYLLAAMTFGGFYIYLERLTQWRAMAFFIIVVGAAILANTIRIVIVIIAGNLTAMQHPWVHDHLMLGWYIFAAMLFPVFWVGYKLGDMERICQKRVTSRTGSVVLGKAVSYTFLVPLVILSLSSGPLLKSLLQKHYSEPEGKRSIVISASGAWHKTDINNEETTLHPLFKGNDFVFDRIYAHARDKVRLYIATYLIQEQGKELINVNNHLYNEELWQPKHKLLLQTDNGKRSVIETELVNSAGQRKLIWYWYRSAGMNTTSAVISKLLDIYGMFTGKSGSSVLMLETDFMGDLEKGRQRLRMFVADNISEIEQRLDSFNIVR